MIQTFIHSTENNNFYIYDDQSRLSMLIHPELQKAHMRPQRERIHSGGIQRYFTSEFEIKPQLMQRYKLL